MRRLLVLSALLLPGCFLNEHGKGGGTGDDDCILPPTEPNEDQPLPGGPRTSPVQPQRNPQNLTCQAFGGGGCDPACGPCPETALAPTPSWGLCFSSCESLDEATCETDPTCRVIKDAVCSVLGDCVTDFIACVATDQFVDANVSCTAADADSCSRNPACTAYHTNSGCKLDNNDPSCTAEFSFCGPEGRGAGHCSDGSDVTCDRQPPACPPGSSFGVENGCFTDVCIPPGFPCDGIPI